MPIICAVMVHLPEGTFFRINVPSSAEAAYIPQSGNPATTPGSGSPLEEMLTLTSNLPGAAAALQQTTPSKNVIINILRNLVTCTRLFLYASYRECQGERVIRFVSREIIVFKCVDTFTSLHAAPEVICVWKIQALLALFAELS